MSKNGNVYDGQWEAYQRDMSRMGFYQKIAYDYELKSILRRINPKKISFLRTIVFAFLMVGIMSFLVQGGKDTSAGGTGPLVVTRVIAYFLSFFIVLLAADLFVIRKIRNKAMPGSTLLTMSLLLAIISIAVRPVSENDVSWFLATTFIITCITFEIFRELSYRGSKELEEKVKTELNTLAWNIKSDISGGYNFKDGVVPNCKIPLVEGEIVYMEEPAIVSEVSEKSSLSDIGGRLFQRISNIDLSTPYSLLHEARHIWERTTCDISKSKGKDKRVQALKNKFENKLGTVLVTNKRVLFVGGEHGFQIQIANIIDFGSNSDMTNPMLTIESSSGRRTMKTEGSIWLAMFIEKVKNESIRVNA